MRLGGQGPDGAPTLPEVPYEPLLSGVTKALSWGWTSEFLHFEGTFLMVSGTWLGTLSAPVPNPEQHIPRAEWVFPREGGLREEARIEEKRRRG